jgi:hypothetical protein
MKKILTILITLFAAVQLKAITYTVTNDLNSTFTVFYWTNNAGNIQQSFFTNMPPNAKTNFFVSTNGAAGMGVYQTNATAYLFVSWTNMTFSSSYLSVMYATAMSQIAPTDEQVPQTQTILKSYYITGARPKQANYWEWIDTMFFYVNVLASNAAVAQASAQTASTAIRCYGTLIVSNSFWVPTNLYGCTLTFMRITNNTYARINFNTPAATPYYVPIVDGLRSSPSIAQQLTYSTLSITNKTVNGFALQPPDLNQSANPTNITFVVFSL